MSDEEELTVAVASARIAGVHPTWIKWAMETVSTLGKLRYMTSAVEHGNKDYTTPLAPKWKEMQR